MIAWDRLARGLVDYLQKTDDDDDQTPSVPSVIPWRLLATASRHRSLVRSTTLPNHWCFSGIPEQPFPVTVTGLDRFPDSAPITLPPHEWTLFCHAVIVRHARVVAPEAPDVVVGRALQRWIVRDAVVGDALVSVPLQIAAIGSSATRDTWIGPIDPVWSACILFGSRHRLATLAAIAASDTGHVVAEITTRSQAAVTWDWPAEWMLVLRWVLREIGALLFVNGHTTTGCKMVHVSAGSTRYYIQPFDALYAYLTLRFTEQGQTMTRFMQRLNESAFRDTGWSA